MMAIRLFTLAVTFTCGQSVGIALHRINGRVRAHASVTPLLRDPSKQLSRVGWLRQPCRHVAGQPVLPQRLHCAEAKVHTRAGAARRQPGCTTHLHGHLMQGLVHRLHGAAWGAWQAQHGLTARPRRGGLPAQPSLLPHACARLHTCSLQQHSAQHTSLTVCRAPAISASNATCTSCASKCMGEGACGWGAGRGSEPRVAVHAPALAAQRERGGGGGELAGGYMQGLQHPCVQASKQCTAACSAPHRSPAE